MKLIPIPKQREVHIVGCKSQLQFIEIDKLAKDANLKDYTIKESAVIDGETFERTGYSYILKY